MSYFLSDLKKGAAFYLHFVRFIILVFREKILFSLGFGRSSYECMNHPVPKLKHTHTHTAVFRLTEVVWRAQCGENTGEELQAHLDLGAVAVPATSQQTHKSGVSAPFGLNMSFKKCGTSSYERMNGCVGLHYQQLILSDSACDFHDCNSICSLSVSLMITLSFS